MTRIGFNANQFVLMSGSGDKQYSPFAVVDGQVFMDSAFIQNGSIDNAKIGNDIQSNDFIQGRQGWRISKTAGFEMHSGRNGYRISLNGDGFKLFSPEGNAIIELGLFD